ncbi:MAG: type II toxin-antitoxin system RelE/ParE family toxin [Patescibacteria group bacterium]
MKRIEVIYDDDVVRFIATLDTRTKVKVVRVIDLLEKYGHTLRMPYSKPVASGLFELRTTGNIQARILFGYREERAVLLHAFIKKTNAIARTDIEKALRKFNT